MRSRATLDLLRRYAIARSLFKPTTLGRAIAKLGFVQADPIRAPARAQDLTLRHRVLGYCAGDLERKYPRLAIEEDYFVNYGFLPRANHALMHPRMPRSAWRPSRAQQARAVLDFIRARGAVHPRAVDAHFAHGKSTNWFGGTSNASTQLLDAMHYRGLLRVARREGGVRVFAVPKVEFQRVDGRSIEQRFDALVDILVNKYAPLPARSLGHLMSLLCGGVPQWRSHRGHALARAKQRLGRARLDGAEWYWPCEENPLSSRWRPDGQVRLLAPFDPIVWDRRRFEMFWGWAYRFEAYTPAAKRRLGYYALPVLWRERVVGWGNLAVRAGSLQAAFGYVEREPAEAEFRDGLEAELQRLRSFLRLPGDVAGPASLCYS
jgi:hypothetical protein